ncbi:MAG: bifunctional 3-deoxy-7-phosphoheptulonate synthase/chorismate mutase type II [Odoribacteraceae bacterium]|jgi:chorismate mutase|nr:bifunctional 3-deoxy-7-phosphoheptulonate synthase/chorismate mutase type II [Odoribacteraceae bacterium]
MKIDLKLTPIANHLEDPGWPLLIAGPCSAESERQMLDTARQLKASNRISCFRAGIWKPRTRPGAFEGVGEIGLEWMQAVKRETGLLTACEVATAEHARLAMKYGVDILWVGARTSANPFSVQEIADTIKGCPVTVLVKNPVNPDLQLWIGALERLNRAGITRLAAIHRGFSAYEKTPFRNAPLWNIAIELKTICPGLPIICDPSHITGARELVPLVAQKALDLDMHGLMVEVHNNPDVAKSDAAQQLLPVDYARMIRDLRLREASPLKAGTLSALDAYRQEIDALDDGIMQKLARRMELSRKIGEYKRENNLMVLQLSRWEEILHHRAALGKAMGMDEGFVKKLLELVHEESINLQAEIMNEAALKKN